jgi:hypothetical protein
MASLVDEKIILEKHQGVKKNVKAFYTYLSLHRDTTHLVHIARHVATHHRLLSPTEVVAHIQADRYKYRKTT